MGILDFLKKKDNPNKSLITITENASLCPLPINKKGTDMTQYWIFCDQLRREVLYGNQFDLLVCDRSIVDSIAYGSFLGFKEICEAKYQLAKTFMHTYTKIYFKSTDKNDWWYADGVRDHKDLQYRLDVEQYMLAIYKRLLDDGCEFEFEVI